MDGHKADTAQTTCVFSPSALHDHSVKVKDREYSIAERERTQTTILFEE